MSGYETPEPILNSPFDEPSEHWHIVEGEQPERRPGRRPATYFYRDPKAKPETGARRVVGTAIELKLVNRIRAQVKKWRLEGYPGVTRTTLELLHWWRRDGRAQRMFFAQLDAVDTIIFLTEARADYRQGIEIPQEEISESIAKRWLCRHTIYHSSVFAPPSQSLIVRSQEALARRVPSGEKVMQRTPPAWPLRVRKLRPVARSQNLMVWSSDALAKTLPSGETARLRTHPVWPVRVFFSTTCGISKSLMVASRLPVISVLASGVKVMAPIQ